MNKLKFIFLFLILILAVSCSQIKTAVNSVSGSQPVELKIPAADLVKDVKNSSPDSHIDDDKAIVVSALRGNQFFIGRESHQIKEVGFQTKMLLEKDPSERQLIYLNAENLTKYGDVVQLLENIRNSGAENIGLIVASNGKPEPGYHVLKVKIPAEPNVENLDAEWAAKKNDQYLLMEENGKINSANFDEKELYKPDKTDIKLEEVSNHISGKINKSGNKTIHIRGSRSKNYGEIVRLVDAAIGGGATTVYLDLDDLRS